MLDVIQNKLAIALESQGLARAVRTHGGNALGSSVGLVRKRNEDSCLVARASYVKGNRTNFTVAVICDGLGGMSQGREASILAASAFTAHLFCAPSGGWKERLFNAVAYANAEVYQRLRGDGGTTLSAVLSPYHAGAMLCHVGDSRIYGVSRDRAVEQLSRDDTINALLNKRENEADVPKDSRLLQFVGIGEEMEAQLAPIPDHCRSVLLTSDGAHDVPSSVLQRIVSNSAVGSDLVRKLISLSEMLGGRDNASAILLPIGAEADLYDGIRENELLAIFPNETLNIYIAGSEGRQISERVGNASFENPGYKRALEIENGSPKTGAVTSDPKQRFSPKRNGTTTKSRKTKNGPNRSKAGAAVRLPLEESGAEVDVQFSAPIDHPERGKQ